MFDYGKDLTFDLVLPRLKFVSSKQVLMEFARDAAKNLQLSESLLFEKLWEQEQASSSGIGGGVAIVHLKAVGPQRPFVILATLDREIDFNAIDGAPVNIAAFVLSPESDGPLHLRRLSRISRLLSNEILQKRILEARDELAVRSLLIDPDGWLLAA